MSKKTPQQLDSLFTEIRTYFAGIVTDLTERLEKPAKQFGFFGSPAPVTSDKNLQAKKDCIGYLDAFRLNEAMRLFSITGKSPTTPVDYANRIQFAKEFRTFLNGLFQPKPESGIIPPCYQLPRVSNLMENKRTGEPYKKEDFFKVIQEYTNNEYRHKPGQGSANGAGGDGGGGMGAPTIKYDPATGLPLPPEGISNAAVSMPEPPQGFGAAAVSMPEPPQGFAAAAAAAPVAVPLAGGRRRIRRKTRAKRRHRARKTTRRR
jgi:hypothetical protein